VFERPTRRLSTPFEAKYTAQHGADGQRVAAGFVVRHVREISPDSEIGDLASARTCSISPARP